MGWSLSHKWWVKFRKVISGASRPPAQHSRGRKISPHNFWLQKPTGIESVEETARAPSNFSERTHTQTQLPSLTPSEFHYQGSILRAPEAYLERLKCLASG